MFLPPYLGQYATWTSTLRRLFKFGTNHRKASRNYTQPVVYGKAKPNSFLVVRQNWMAASENCGLRQRLPLAAANNDIPLPSKIFSERLALSPTLYCFQLMEKSLGLQCGG